MNTVEQSRKPAEAHTPAPAKYQRSDSQKSDPPRPPISGPIRCYRFEPPPELLEEYERKFVNAWEPVKMKLFPDVPDDPKVKKLVEEAVAQNGYAPFSQERQIGVMSALRTYGSPYVPPSFGLNPWSEVMKERGDDEVANCHWTGGFGTGVNVLSNYRNSCNQLPPPSALQVGSPTPISELMYRPPTVDPTVIRYDGERYAKWNCRPQPPSGPPPGVTITGKYMSLLTDRGGPRSNVKTDAAVDEPLKKFPSNGDVYVPKPFGSVYRGGGESDVQSGKRYNDATARPSSFGSAYRGGDGTHRRYSCNDRSADFKSTGGRLQCKSANDSTSRGEESDGYSRSSHDIVGGSRFEQSHCLDGCPPSQCMCDRDCSPHSDATENLDRIATLFPPPKFPERVPESLKHLAPKLSAFELPTIDDGNLPDVIEEPINEKFADDCHSTYKPENVSGLKQGCPLMSTDELKKFADEKLGEYSFDPMKYMGRVKSRELSFTTHHGRKVVRRELKQHTIHYFADQHDWDDYLNE